MRWDSVSANSAASRREQPESEFFAAVALQSLQRFGCTRDRGHFRGPRKELEQGVARLSDGRQVFGRIARVEATNRAAYRHSPPIAFPNTPSFPTSTPSIRTRAPFPGGPATTVTFASFTPSA